MTQTLSEHQSENEVTVYRGFEIWFWAPPIPIRNHDWHFQHRDFDGDGDTRSGSGSSIQDCKNEIDEMILDLEEAAQAKGGY